MSKVLSICDSPQAVKVARTACPDALVVTDNPLLADEDASIVDISRLLPQADATRLGEAIIDTLLQIDRTFAASDIDRRYGLLTSKLNVTIAMRATAASLLQRGTMLARFLQMQPDFDEVMIAGMRGPRWQETHPWSMPRFAPPSDTLSRHGFFGVRKVAGHTVNVPVPDLVGDVPTDDLLSRIMLVPMSLLTEELLRRFGLRSGAGNRPIYIGKSAENLRETLPWLAARGFGTRAFAMPAYGKIATPAENDPVNVNEWLEAQIRPILQALPCDFDAGQCRAYANALLEHMDAGLRSTAAAIPRMIGSLDAVAAETPGAAILTGGLYGPLATNFHAAASARGIVVVDFEHGATTGIAKTAQRRLEVSEATTCDLLVVGASRAARAFAKAGGPGEVAVVGLPDQTRRLLRQPLQKWHARRRLGLSASDEVVMHVSGILYGGNMRFGDDAPVEALVHQNERRLMLEAYADLPRKVLYKSYPAIRMAYQPEIQQRIALAANIVPVPREDFRYIRAAADLLVSEASMSTLGWCLGSDVPFIHLQSQVFNCLADEEVYENFAESFFVIDMDQDDWSNRLRALLQRPLSDIRAEWAAKSRRRTRFLEDAFFGPAGVMGRRAAQEVVKFLDQPRSSELRKVP